MKLTVSHGREADGTELRGDIWAILPKVASVHSIRGTVGCRILMQSGQQLVVLESAEVVARAVSEYYAQTVPSVR